MNLDLDDEEAFLAALPGAMNAQKAKGIDVSQSTEEIEPEHRGISVVRKQLHEPIPEPVEYEKPSLTKRLAVVDLETDPFKYDRKPEPFACGFAMDDGSYVDFWGDECVTDFFDHLISVDNELTARGEEMVIYAHNGGKFDFHYFMDYLDEDSRPFFIDKRMVKINFLNIEFRDSYSLIPVALKKLQTGKWRKLEIDYNKMERLFREQNKPEILEYLRADCMTLIENVREFIERFGWRITIASTSLPLLESFHGFDKMEPDNDVRIRPFYKGGRVECFERGLIRGSFVMVDANSMYPAAMSNFQHPVSAIPFPTKDIEDADFLLVEATNRGCLGVGDGLGFDFSCRKGKFFASIHEIRAGLDTGTLDIHRVIQGWRFTHHDRFDRFVDFFYQLRLDAKAQGDIAGTEFYKLILNSAYGKLAQSTARYRDYLINPTSLPYPRYGPLTFEKMEVEGEMKNVCTQSPQGWRPDMQLPGMFVYSKPKRNAGQVFLNVATAASITGAARSVLWRAVCSSDRPLYCDTDSIICSKFHGDMDDSRLGAWKVEATGDAVLIAGKKMYAFLSKTPSPDKEKVTIDGDDFWLIKKAHKGVQLRADQILEIVRGGELSIENDAPTFGLGGKVSFVKRKVKMTGKDIDVAQLELPLG
jgi:DNA polymerase type B, organellar and viral